MSDASSNLDPATGPGATPSAKAGEPATTPYAATAGPAATGPMTGSGPTAFGATAASGATATTGATVLPDTRRNQPLFGTIFWGVVLLTFAGLMVVQAVFPVTLDPTLWLVGSVLVIGLLLVVAGIAAAARRAG